MAQTQTTEINLADMTEQQLIELTDNAANQLANIRLKKTQLIRDRIAVIYADIHTLAAELTELKATEQLVLQKIQSQTNKCYELESSISTDSNICCSGRAHKFVDHSYFCMHRRELCTRLRCSNCLAYSNLSYIDNCPC